MPPRARLQQTGQGAFYVYLPKKWFATNSMKKGDLLDVYGAESYLLLSPSLKWKMTRENPVEILATDDPGDLYWRILSSYVHGCLRTRIMRKDGKQFDTKQLMMANEILHKLRGIEPTLAQDQIEYLDITDYEQTRPFVELARMFKTIGLLFEQNRLLLNPDYHFETLADVLHQHWISEKEQVNPISFYIHRILNVVLEYPELCPVNNIPSLGECQFVGLVTYVLERIGDTLYAIGEHVAELSLSDPSQAGEIMKFPPEYIRRRLRRTRSEDVSRALALFQSRITELSNLIRIAERVVSTRNPAEAMRLAEQVRKWRADMRVAPVRTQRLADPVPVRSLFAIHNRLGELSSYLESLGNRTCQFYHYL